MDISNLLANRVTHLKASAIREIFKMVGKSDIISFAGGLPNPISFPQEELKVSMDRITSQFGGKIYQYSN